jgi:hypothetical protein
MVTFYHDIEQNLDSKANPKECRQIVKEFLYLETKYGIPVTYNVVGKLFREQPDLIELIIQEGQEVAFHSYNHQPDWQPRYYSDEITLCRAVSSLPCGYRSPQSKWNRTTLKILWEKGFLWNAESDRHKEPYFIYEGLVRLPIAQDDWPLHTGALSIEEWVQQFPRLLKMRSYFGFGCHDFVTSFATEERLKAWEKVLQIAIENKTLVVTFSEAADLFRRAAALHYYSKHAKTWNRWAKTSYHPADTYPANWTYIGPIQSKFTPQPCGRTIPVSAFVFRFPNQRYDYLITYLLNVGQRFPNPIKRLGKWFLSQISHVKLHGSNR